MSSADDIVSCDVLVLGQHYHHHALRGRRVRVDAFVVLDSSRDCRVFVVMLMGVFRVIVRGVVSFVVLAAFVVRVVFRVSGGNRRFPSFTHPAGAGREGWSW